jgi:hypothetical protein
MQGRVRQGERIGRQDDIVGGGWMLLTLDKPADAKLSPSQRAFVDQIGMRLVALRPDGQGTVDVDGSYRAYMTGLGVRAVLVRPDFYTYATAKSLAEIPALLDELQQQLWQDAAPAPHASSNLHSPTI